jgi:hypothetical protein
MVTYHIDYQYMKQGDARPTDEGIVVGIEVTDRSGVVVLPNVGDFVQIDNSMQQPRGASFSGSRAVTSLSLHWTQ